MTLKKIFEIEKKPKRGFMALEWVIIVYMLLTLLLTLFCYTKVQHPDAMIWERVRIGAVTIAIWMVYRLVPCPATRLLRVLVQLLMLGWWYEDTYHINSLFTNLDPIFARAEQSVFGLQPSLVFAQKFPHPVISEILDMGYVSYYPIIAAVIFYYFFKRYKEFERTGFIIIASFFAFYVIFDLVPVTGPMYYFYAVGLDNIRQGIFPEVGDYFLSHIHPAEVPGYKDGFFYQFIMAAHQAERPTAAFPSSHVGISVVVVLLAWRSRCKSLFVITLSLTVLIFFATVYIQAHYAIDAIAGLLVGTAFYFLWSWVGDKALGGKY